MFISKSYYYYYVFIIFKSDKTGYLRSTIVHNFFMLNGI